MTELTHDIEYTGEFFVPGRAGRTVEEEHLERYQFAAGRVGGKRVLDVACGVGYGSEMLMGGGAASYNGVDINPNLVAHAARIYGGPKVSFQHGDVTQLPFENEFDFVTSFETIEHVPDYQGALRNLYRALKPGGEILISSPNRKITSPKAADLQSKPANPYHVREFLPSELGDALTEAGFATENRELYGQRLRVFGPTTFIGRVIRRLHSPDLYASPRLQRLVWRQPAYFVIRAEKPA